METKRINSQQNCFEGRGGWHVVSSFGRGIQQKAAKPVNMRPPNSMPHRPLVLRTRQTQAGIMERVHSTPIESPTWQDSLNITMSYTAPDIEYRVHTTKSNSTPSMNNKRDRFKSEVSFGATTTAHTQQNTKHNKTNQTQHSPLSMIKKRPMYIISKQQPLNKHKPT